jgi:transposase-like protein
VKNKYAKRTHISERQFRGLLRHFAVDLSALTSSKLTGLAYATTHRFYVLLRARLITLALAEARPFAGEVEIDESYFGPRRVRGKRGRGAGGKIPVVGLHKRGHHVFVSVVKNCSREQLLPIIRGRVLGKSDVYTDGWTAYDGLVTGGYKHHRVHHHENEFARGKNHVNGIESFWSFAKFRMIKLRGVRRSKFLDHLKECEWRFNHRRSNIYQLLLSNCRQLPL